MAVDPERVATLVHDVARELVAAGPAPPPLPWLGLDHPSGTGFHLLDALSTRGIFRKYELVLALGAGLGAGARWLAARLGCEVVGTCASEAEAHAAHGLTRRTAVRAQVRFLPAACILPLQGARFTHVWIVEALARAADPATALAESFRVIRPGGTLAVQDLVRPAATDTIDLPGWRFLAAESLPRLLAGAGFVEIESRDVSAQAPERSARVVAARQHLVRRAATIASLTALVAERAALADALAAGRLRVLQLTARRP